MQILQVFKPETQWINIDRTEQTYYACIVDSATLLAGLDTALETLATVQPHANEVVVQGEMVVALRRRVDRLEGIAAAWLAAFQTANGPASEGAPNSVAWLKSRCHLSSGAASDRSQIANALESLPLMSEALSSGEIGVQQAAAISRLATTVGVEAVKPIESDLVAEAKRVDADQLQDRTRYERQRIDAEAALDEVNRQHERRRLRLSRNLGGMYVIEGLLDGEGGAMLHTALDALTQPAGKDDTRTAEQRRADALVELSRRGLTGKGLPEVAGQRPHLVVTVSLETLVGKPDGGPAQLAWGPPLVQESLRRITDDCALTAIVVDKTGNPVMVGRTIRTVPPAVARALKLRDGGCCVENCRRPPEWCQGHHWEHWINGGGTTIANTGLLCGFHQRLHHEEGWKLVPNGDGTVKALPP